MPDWLQELLLAVIGSTALTGGVGWWFKTRRDDRIAREVAHLEQVRELQKELKASQQEVKDRDQDRIRYEMVRRESSDQTGRQLLEAIALLKEMTRQMGDITVALTKEDDKKDPKP